jgi:hypothetical protein
MCESNRILRRAAATIPRPRWARLYGIAFAGLATLTIANVALPDVAQPPLDGLITVAVFVAFALWVRGNRAALDQQDWCECAADTLTVRVIPSRRPDLGRSILPRVSECLPREEDAEVSATHLANV